MPAADANSAARHLANLAREPRPAGGVGEARARAYAEGVLRDAGFTVCTVPFDYSAFPGRWATPAGGVIALATVVVAAFAALRYGAGGASLAILVAGATSLGLFARGMLGDAVLDLPLLRARGDNLVASRGVAPEVWLVAHLDSKSQPIPSAARVAGVMLVALALVAAFFGAALELGHMPHRTVWIAALAAIAAGAPLVMASVVGVDSHGAVDNASGVAAVLAAAARVRPDCPLGVLLPSAEELGLAGARAWARDRRAGIALNCDGIDDDGRGKMTLMYSGAKPGALIEVIDATATEPLRVMRMPLGLLTDSVAFADRGWRAVTLSRGGVATLRRVHTSADSLDTLRGTGLEPAATLLARAVEALS